MPLYAVHHGIIALCSHYYQLVVMKCPLVWVTCTRCCLTWYHTIPIQNRMPRRNSDDSLQGFVYKQCLAFFWMGINLQKGRIASAYFWADRNEEMKRQTDRKTDTERQTDRDRQTDRRPIDGQTIVRDKLTDRHHTGRQPDLESYKVVLPGGLNRS